jgi:hypothetical protein
MVKNEVFSGFPCFPVELVNIIFTLAAESSRHTCLALCLVASWARQIALPHLFCTLVMKDHNVEFDKYLADPPYMPVNTNIDAASLVKNVWMPSEDYDTTELAIDIFENCPNITHMGLTIYRFYQLIYSTSPIHISYLRRKVLGPAFDNYHDLHITILGATSFAWACRQNWNPNVLLRSPLYDRTTRVRVETVDSYNMPYKHRLHHFSRLSHLSVPYYHATQHIVTRLDIFLELQSLEMFVVAGVKKPLQQAQWKRLQEWVREKRKTDKRVFFVEIPAVDIQVEWEREMRGGESIWDQALRYTTRWEAKEREKLELVRTLSCRQVVILTYSARDTSPGTTGSVQRRCRCQTVPQKYSMILMNASSI